MSAFDNYDKDNVVDAIESLARAEQESGATPREIVESIMKTVSYGLDRVMYELTEKAENS